MIMTIVKEKYSLEYPFKSSVKILFSRLSTPSGLSEWFADDVNAVNDIFTFQWSMYKQRARLLNLKDSHFVRFQWIDFETNTEDDYFEFKISQDPLTGEVLLTITDFAEAKELQENKELWDMQINELRRMLGS